LANRASNCSIVSIRCGPRVALVALGARIIGANGRVSPVNGDRSED
jgi:hypothetical protein